jgi:glycosyltransferase involved in cell wall biosynthesis
MNGNVRTIPSTEFKVALVHDWLTGMRGGEKCLEVLCQFFPQATLYTIFHQRGAMSPVIEGMRVKTSWIADLPLAGNHFRAYLPLFPAAIESFNLSEYQLVISTSHCVAKGIIPAPGALHLSYIHTPMRYIWEMYPHYLGKTRNPLKRLGAALLASYLRSWDVNSCNHVDHFIANSQNVAGRIWRHYRRESVVIHPPVDTDFFHPVGPAGDYYLIVTALVPYKQVHLAIQAFNRMPHRLIVVGDGPEKSRLVRMAGSNVEFLPWSAGEALRNLYSGCKALVFPGEEDFGIVPLEAQSCGRPVVAYGRGGVLETVVPVGQTNPSGVFFYELTPEALMAAVEELDKRPWDADAIRQHTLSFAKPIYTQKLADFINQCVGEKFGVRFTFPI